LFLLLALILFEFDQGRGFFLVLLFNCSITLFYGHDHGIEVLSIGDQREVPVSTEKLLLLLELRLKVKYELTDDPKILWIYHLYDWNERIWSSPTHVELSLAIGPSQIALLLTAHAQIDRASECTIESSADLVHAGDLFQANDQIDIGAIGGDRRVILGQARIRIDLDLRPKHG